MSALAILKKVEERLRKAVEEEAPGLNLLEDVEHGDAEAIARCLAKQLRDHHHNAQVVIEAAETKDRQRANDMEQAHATAADCKAQVVRLTKDLASSTRQLTDLQARIAFLGTHWEKLTGEVNTQHVEDPQVKLKSLTRELQETRTALFNSELDGKGLARELKTERANSMEREALLEKWTQELYLTRDKDKALVELNHNLSHKVEKLSHDSFAQMHISKKLEEDKRELARKLNLVHVHKNEVESRLDRTERKLGHATKVIADVTAEHKDTANQLGLRANELESLQLDFTESTASAQELRAQLEATRSRLAKAEANIERLEAILEQKVRNVGMLESQFKEMYNEAQNYRHELSDCDRKLHSSEAEVQALKGAVTKATNDYTASQAKLKSAEATCEDVRAELRASRAALDASQKQGAEIALACRKNEFQLKQVRVEKQGFEHHSKILTSELKTSQTKLVGAGKMITELDTSTKNLGAEYQLASSELREARALNVRLSEELSTTNARLRASETDLKDWKGRHAKTALDLVASRSDLQDRTASVNRLERQGRTLTTQLNKTSETAEGLEGDVTRLLKDLQVREKQLQKSELRALGLQKELDNAQEALRASGLRAKDLEKSEKVLKIKLNDSQAGKLEAGLQTQKLQGELANEERLHAGTDQELAIIRTKFDQLTVEWRHYKEKLGRSEREKEQLERELAVLRQQLKDAQAETLKSKISENNLASQFAFSQTDVNWGAAGARARDKDLTIARRTKALEDTTADMALLKDSIRNMDREMSDREARIQNAGRRAEGLEAELMTERDNVRKVEKARGIAERKAESYSKELEAMRVRLKEREDREIQILRELRSCKATVGELTDDRNKLVEELKAKALEAQ